MKHHEEINPAYSRKYTQPSLAVKFPDGVAYAHGVLISMAAPRRAEDIEEVSGKLRTMMFKIHLLADKMVLHRAGKFYRSFAGSPQDEIIEDFGSVKDLDLAFLITDKVKVKYEKQIGKLVEKYSLKIVKL